MIVVFDGACNVCNGYARFLRRRDRHGRLVLVAAQSPAGRAALAACGEALDDPSTMLAGDGRRWLMRSDAVLASVAALGGGWRAVRLAGLIPRRLRDAGYLAFARRRYRWFGRAAACPLPAPPAERPRR